MTPTTSGNAGELNKIKTDLLFLINTPWDLSVRCKDSLQTTSEFKVIAWSLQHGIIIHREPTKTTHFTDVVPA